MERVDGALEMERWAEQAAQTSAAHLARFSISGGTSTPPHTVEEIHEIHVLRDQGKPDY